MRVAPGPDSAADPGYKTPRCLPGLGHHRMSRARPRIFKRHATFSKIKPDKTMKKHNHIIKVATPPGSNDRPAVVKITHDPPEEQIRQRAHELYMARGGR